MTQLTDSMIINSFNSSSPFLKLELILFSVMFLVLGVVYFIKFKREKTTSGKKSIIIGIVIVLFLLGIPVFKGFLKYNAINYSVQNNSWYVVTDTVERTKSSTDDDGDTSYYVYLSEHGKVSVGRRTYYDLFNCDSVYVVIVKGRFGGTYATSQIYPTDEYIYKK